MRFVLIGDGAIAKYHRKAIEHVGGKIECIYDPGKHIGGVNLLDEIPIVNGIHRIRRYLHPKHDNYIVICSPSYMHRPQIKEILEDVPYRPHIICEKPAFLPWEQIIENDRLNIVMQLRYLPNLPTKANLVKMVYVRDKSYFNSWKGDPKNTGGLFFNLFIHGIDIANRLGADFEGVVKSDGKQERFVLSLENKKIDILNINIQDCYNRMYEAILCGNGIKPKDLFYLMWSLYRNSEIHGYGKNGMNKRIKIDKELL